MNQLSLYGVFEAADRLPDPSRRKHGGDAASTDAFNRTAIGRRRHYRAIVDALLARGASGITLKEYAEANGLHPNDVSGRFSEMNKLGMIFKRPLDRRGGCAVWYLGRVEWLAKPSESER